MSRILQFAVTCLLCLLPTVCLAGGTYCPGPVTTPGIDISEWQGGIDWGAVATAKKYAIVRVSDGFYQDKTFNFNWPACQAAGLICGVYQFFEPGKDAIAQADLLLNKMGPLKPGMLPPMLDVEATGGQPPGVIENGIAAWVAHVKAATGRDPIIYTGKWFWDGNVQSNAQGNLPLAHAQYCNNCCPSLAAPWTAWVIWQFSSTGSVPGIGGNVDSDHWNGDLANLQLFAGKQLCKPKCESSSTIVGADCGKGNCAAFGAKCVDDNLGVRCASVFCPTQGAATVCIPDPKNSKIGNCSNGAIEIGECATFAGLCSTGGGQPAHCASVFCVGSPSEAPKEHDICLPDGKRYHCDKAGLPQPIPCAAGTTCTSKPAGAICEGKCKAKCDGSKIIGPDCGVGDCAAYGATCVDDDLGVRCASVFCPAKGGATVCIPEPAHSKIGTCSNGAIEIGECGAFGSWCSTAFVPPKCVPAFCTAAFDQKPTDKDVCLPNGKRVHCDANGGFADKPCGAGQSCVTSAGGAATCSGACKPHCEGSVIVGGDCGKGDCGAFAATCVDDDLGVRCASIFCPAKGKKAECLDMLKTPGKVYLCQDGGLSSSDCASGQICNQGGQDGHCAATACVSGSNDVPVVKDFCASNGVRHHCNAAGVMSNNPCPSGETCSGAGMCSGPTCPVACSGDTLTVANCAKVDCASTQQKCVTDATGSHCVTPKCAGSGLSAKCEGNVLQLCNGSQSQSIDCTLEKAWCSKTPQGAMCVSKLCLTKATDAPFDHDVCATEGRMHCNADGTIAANPCPDNKPCNACGSCGPALPETCNGHDDDCNGEIDDVPGGCGGQNPDGGGQAGAGNDDAGGAAPDLPGLDVAAAAALDGRADDKGTVGGGSDSTTSTGSTGNNSSSSSCQAVPVAERGLGWLLVLLLAVLSRRARRAI